MELKERKKMKKTLSLKHSFKARVLEIVASIPKGKMLTYMDVALRAGNKRASRAVGSILRRNYDPLIPCHRVIRSDGSLGNYNRGNARKELLLIEEGALKKEGNYE